MREKPYYFALGCLIVFLAFFYIANTAVLQSFQEVPITDQKKSNQAVPAITGRATSGTIGLAIVPPCYYIFEQGWNFVSLCSVLSNYTISEALNGTDYRFVLEWDETTQEFVVYSPLAASNPFTTFNATKSYFILSEDSGTILPIQGTEYNDTNLNLPATGWNTPFYPFDVAGNVTVYLDTLGNNYRFLMIWDVQDQEFDIYSRLAALNPFDTIESGQGQFIFIETNPLTLQYDKSNVTS